MYDFQTQINSSLLIKVISTFHTFNLDDTLNDDNDEDSVECMFLQEKIESAIHLNHCAEQLKHRIQTKQVSQIDALQKFAQCYDDVANFDGKLHSIGYIHGDIIIGNILYGTKISVQVSLTNINSTGEKSYHSGCKI